MHYSFTDNRWHPEKVEKLKTLLACENIRMLTKQGGGNSVVYCIEADGHQWAVKSYPPYAHGKRDRLAAELMVYQFLNTHQVPTVPQLKTFSEEERWLVIDWISGEIPTHYSKETIAQAIDFISAIAKLNQLEAAKVLPKAAESCDSLLTLIQQIQARLDHLQTVTAQEPELKSFLEQDFIPTFEQLKNQAIQGYQAHQMNPDQELAQEKRSLIPADFGFHNTIQDKEGKLYFFDFDYFGWDDPVKLLADILWHPKMQLTEMQKQQFIQGISAIYQTDKEFLIRFQFTWPLFGLRWVLILLNEFIPAIWQNRKHANVYQDHEEAKRIQLKRAQILLLNVQQIGCPYDAITATSI